MNQIIFFRDKNGINEVEEYIEELIKRKDKDSRIKSNKIIGYLREVSQKGTQIGEKYIKHIDKEIWELRPLKDRILFAYIDNNKFIILSKFVKKTKKTPKIEIVKAKNLLKKYKEGKE